MIEWYRVNADYRDVMNDFENLFIKILKDLDPKVDLREWIYQGQKYDLSLPWPRISVAEAFNKYCGIDTETLLDEKKLLEAGKSKGYKIDKSTNWEQMFLSNFSK